MCTLALAYKYHPKYPLIFIGNRDEFYARPTLDAHKHDGIISGVDLEKGGTWTGITDSGKFGFITNYRDFSKHVSDPKSRGLLINEYFNSNCSPLDFLKTLTEKKLNYDPFNLIVGTLDELGFYSNIGDEIKLLAPGLYGLSNASLDTPWPKVERIKKDLSDFIESNLMASKYSDEILYESLFKILENRDIANDDELPETGIDLELERSLSSLFIELDAYGTRYETVILIDEQNSVYYYEKARQEQGRWTLQKIKFNINSGD